MTPLIAIALFVQDSPVDIPKAEWPAKVECAVCLANGVSHDEERPVGAMRYKGTAFFFCNKKEIAEFKKDPDAFMPPVLPRPMPKFSLTDVSGKAWTEASFNDRVVFVDFWATWCEPCKKLKPVLEKVRDSYASKGVEVLSVSIDEKKPALDNFLTKSPFANPVLFDSDRTWQTWKVRVVPMLFLVKDGQIVAQWTGLVEEETLRKSVESALGD